MHFNIAEWRRFYDKVKVLDKKLKDSLPTIKEKIEYPSLINLSVDEQKKIEQEIHDLIKLSDSYLNICGMPSVPVLWKYNNDDPTTWASSKYFKYSHLIKESNNA
jgi:hypothetical protein